MFASNLINTLCMHAITKKVATWSLKIYLHLESVNMARNDGTLVGLERKRHFQFNYRKRINGLKLIRRGSEHQAIVKKYVRKKIQPVDPNLYESLLTGRKEEGEIQYDFLYSPDGKILPNSPGITISYFSSLKAVYFCRHLRDHRRDYLWLAVT